MAPETRDWSIPAPVRTLLWWPAISFVLVVVAPEAATGAIVGAGAVLALLGGLLTAAARRLRSGTRVLAVDGPTPEETTIELASLAEPTTTELPVIGAQPRGRVA